MITASRIGRIVTLPAAVWMISGMLANGTAAALERVIPASFTVTVSGTNYAVPTSISWRHGVVTGQLDVSSLAGQNDVCTILAGSTDKRGQLNMQCKESVFGFALGFAGTLGIKNGKGAGTYTGPISGTYTSSKQKS